MSKTEVQCRARDLVMRYYTAYNAENWQTCLSLLSPDVVHDHPKGRESGKLSFERSVFQAVCCRLQFSNISICASQSGRQAAAKYTILHRYLNTAPEMIQGSIPSHHLQGRSFFDVKGGLIRRITTYFDLKEWMGREVVAHGARRGNAIVALENLPERRVYADRFLHAQNRLVRAS